MKNNISIESYISLQEKDSTYQFSNNMVEFLAATTYERIHRHAKEFNWNISYIKHTDQKKGSGYKKSKKQISRIMG